MALLHQAPPGDAACGLSSEHVHDAGQVSCQVWPLAAGDLVCLGVDAQPPLLPHAHSAERQDRLVSQSSGHCLDLHSCGCHTIRHSCRRDAAHPGQPRCTCSSVPYAAILIPSICLYDLYRGQWRLPGTRKLSCVTTQSAGHCSVPPATQSAKLQAACLTIASLKGGTREALQG